MRLRTIVQPAILTLPLIAIAAAGLQTIRATYREHERVQAHHPDLAREMDRVVVQLEDVLPPYGRVGYLDPQYFAFQPRAVRQFYLTQYALAPRVVVRDTTLDYVIYFSHEGVPLTTAAIPAGMRVLRHVRPDLAVLTRAR
jgi:hypothetical protein